MAGASPTRNNPHRWGPDTEPSRGSCRSRAGTRPRSSGGIAFLDLVIEGEQIPGQKAPVHMQGWQGIRAPRQRGGRSEAHLQGSWRSIRKRARSVGAGWCTRDRSTTHAIVRAASRGRRWPPTASSSSPTSDLRACLYDFSGKPASKVVEKFKTLGLDARDLAGPLPEPGDHSAR